MEKNFTPVFSTKHEYQAEIARELLESSSILAVVLNKRDSMYQFGHGSIEVYVHKNDFHKAEEILKKLSN